MGLNVGAESGLDSAEGVFLKISNLTLDSADRGEEPDLERVADLLDQALADPLTRRAVLLALSGHLTAAISGAPRDIV